MDSKEILFYLEKLSERLALEGLKGEMALYGGAVMVLAFNARPSTKDVDAVFQPKDRIYRAAREVEEMYGAPADWLNDAVKGFVSGREDLQPFLDLPNLKIYLAGPRYLLAMKALSLRLGRGEKDLEDMLFLINQIGIRSVDEMLSLIEQYYPQRLISPKTQFAIEEVFEALAKGREEKK